MGKLPSQSQKSESLRAGPISFIFEEGTIRSIATCDGELVRRIYMAVRDEFWNTIPGEISNLQIEKTPLSCLLTFDCRHIKDEIDFAWQGRVAGSPNGELVFSMEGEALSSFKRKRIGLCVLHAAALCKGLPCTTESADGGVIRSAFPLLVAPRQPFTNIRSMTYETVDGPAVTLRFEGDLFETEDQRNWTDATFKTYAPPIDAAVGETIEKGTVIRQTVTISASVPKRRPTPRAADALRLDFHVSSLSQRLPRLGFTVDSSMESTGKIGGRAYRLSYSHARIDLQPAESSFDDAAQQAVSIGRHQNIPLECALHLTEEADAEARVIADIFKSADVPIARFLIYHARGPGFLESILPSCVPTLRDAFPHAEIYAGTNGYFVEINRARPPLDIVDGICYSATPQVHTFDNIAVMENMPGLLETLVSAHAFAPGKNIAISPLTLRPRKNPLLPQKDGGPDERRNTLFAAAWMLGSLAWCIEGGLNSLTLGPMSGPEGVLADEEGIFPSFILASWLSPFLGGNAAAECSKSNDPSKVIGIRLSKEGGESVGIAANVTSEPVSVEFGGVGEGCRYSIVDEEVFGQVREMEDPVAGVQEYGVPEGRNSVKLELPAYAIVIFTRGY